MEQPTTTGIVGHRVESDFVLTFEFVWKDRLGQNRFLVPSSWFLKRPQHKPYLKYYVDSKKDEFCLTYVGKSFPTLTLDVNDGAYGIRAIIAERKFGDKILFETDWGVPYQTSWEPLENLVGSEIKLFQFRKLIFKDCNEPVPATSMELLSLSFELGIHIQLAQENDVFNASTVQEMVISALSDDDAEERENIQYEPIELEEINEPHIPTVDLVDESDVDECPMPTAGQPATEFVGSNDISNGTEEDCENGDPFLPFLNIATDLLDMANEMYETQVLKDSVTVSPTDKINNDVYMPIVESVSPPNSPEPPNIDIMNSNIGSLEWKDISKFLESEGCVEMFNSNCMDEMFNSVDWKDENNNMTQ